MPSHAFLVLPLPNSLWNGELVVIEPPKSIPVMATVAATAMRCLISPFLQVNLQWPTANKKYILYEVISHHYNYCNFSTLYVLSIMHAATIQWAEEAYSLKLLLLSRTFQWPLSLVTYVENRNRVMELIRFISNSSLRKYGFLSQPDIHLESMQSKERHFSLKTHHSSNLDTVFIISIVEQFLVAFSRFVSNILTSRTLLNCFIGLT